MKKIDRRFTVAILACTYLWSLGYYKTMDVSMAIATVAVGLAGANAYEKKGKPDASKD